MQKLGSNCEIHRTTQNRNSAQFENIGQPEEPSGFGLSTQNNERNGG
jgi:hypothetical protein